MRPPTRIASALLRVPNAPATAGLPNSAATPTPGTRPKGNAPPVATERSHRRHTPNSGPVALFVDWDNFAIGLRQEMPERPPDLGPILRWARRTGTLIVSRAYGEWRDATERLAIYNAGVDAVYAPVLPLGGSLAARSGVGGAKSLADTAMAVDVAEFLTLVPSVQTLILATSDKDLIPVIRFAQKRGVYSGVVGSDRTASALRELADEFVTYRQLLEDEAPQPVALSRPVTVPPLRIPRQFRRYGDPIAEPLAPVIREPRTLVAAPTVVRREPIVTQAVVPDLNSEAPDPESESARRRRRGGRRRRGAETLALGEAATHVEVEAAVGAPEPVAPPPAVYQPPVASPQIAPARPAIVPPLIAPRAPRPSAERFASPITTSPESNVIRAAQSGDLSTDTAPRGVVQSSASPAPTASPIDDIAPASRPSAETSIGEPGDAAPVRRPRVQLPGERLRRLVPGTEAPPAVAAVDVAPSALAAPTIPAAPAVAPEPDSVAGIDPVESATHETHADDASGNPATPHAEIDGDLPHHELSQSPETDGGDLSAPSRDAAVASTEVSSEETASRARRRRGGRTPRAVGDGTTSPDAPPPVIDGPIASPNDPDAASAPDPEAEGPLRGRRRGGRARVSA